MARRRRSFFFDNINKRLLSNTTKNTKESKIEADAGLTVAEDILKKSQVDSDIDASLANLVNSAPATLDTLNELAAALGDDANFSTTVTNSIATKLAKSSNLSDLTNAATARTNLGLGTAATTASTDYATSAQGTKADTAHGWGNHANAGYGTSSFSGAYADLTGKPTIPTNNNQLTNGAGYITDITTQTDPKYLRSNANDTATGELTFSGSFTSQSKFLNGAQNFDNLKVSGFYSLYNVNASGHTNAPFQYGAMIQAGNTSQGGGMGMQIAHERTGTGTYIRGMNDTNDTWYPWQEIWTSGTDGPGSGLDADTVDGIQGSSIMRLDASGTIPDGVKHTYECYGNIATSSGYQSSLEIFNSGSGTDAFLTFHVGGDYAAYLGVDGGINDLAYGGWSVGAASHRVWHAGNDNVQRSMSTQKWAVASDYGHGIYGVYSATRYQHVWSMGTAYNLPANGQDESGPAGNLYGLAWTYNPNYAYSGSNPQAKSGLNHQLLLMMNGTTYTALGNGVWTSGNVTAYSDLRVKTNIELIPNAVEKVCSLNGYTFDRTDTKIDETTGEMLGTPRQTGVIAQEVMKVLPEAVTGTDEEGYSVAYGNMVGLLIEAIKDQQKQIEELKEKLK